MSEEVKSAEDISLTVVVPIRPQHEADDIVQALRNIADDIEAGEFDLVTTAVVVLGHTETVGSGDGYTTELERCELFGVGPRHDIFTVRGLLSTAITRFANGD